MSESPDASPVGDGGSENFPTAERDRLGTCDWHPNVGPHRKVSMLEPCVNWAPVSETPDTPPIPDKAVEAALDAWWDEVHHPERHDMLVRLRAVLTAAYAADPSRAAAEEVVRAAREYQEWAERVLAMPHASPERKRFAQGWMGSNMKAALTAYDAAQKGET